MILLWNSVSTTCLRLLGNFCGSVLVPFGESHLLEVRGERLGPNNTFVSEQIGDHFKVGVSLMWSSAQLLAHTTGGRHHFYQAISMPPLWKGLLLKLSRLPRCLVFAL